MCPRRGRIKVEGIEVGSPRQAIRAAFDIQLLKEVDVWFELLEDRNRTAHTYNEMTAEEVFESAAKLPTFLRPVLEDIRSLYLAQPRGSS